MIIGKTRTNQPVESSKELEDVVNQFPEIESGDEGKVLMVNSDEDGYELGSVSGGTQLYRHYLGYKEYTTGYNAYFNIITKSPDKITSLSQLETQVKASIPCQLIHCINTGSGTHFMAGIYCDFSTLYIMNGKNDGTAVSVSSFIFGNDAVTPL